MMLNHYAKMILRSTPVLVLSSFLFYYLQIQVAEVYAYFTGDYDPRQIIDFIFFDGYTWIFFLILPMLVNKYFFGESIQEMGLKLPQKKGWAVFWILVALSILLPFILYFSSLPVFQHYAFDGSHPGKLIVVLGILFPIFYVGEEFFFRGFLFLGFWKRIGWHSFWLTDVIFTLTHIGKPVPEILLCIPASIVFNALTLLTRSIYPAVLVHSVMGISLTLSVSYHLF